MKIPVRINALKYLKITITEVIPDYSDCWKEEKYKFKYGLLNFGAESWDELQAHYLLMKHLSRHELFESSYN